VPLAKLKEEEQDFVQVPLTQINWYHHISLLAKVKDDAERAYYITETEDNFCSAESLPRTKPYRTHRQYHYR
jgi:hypothetical protein